MCLIVRPRIRTHVRYPLKNIGIMRSKFHSVPLAEITPNHRQKPDFITTFGLESFATGATARVAAIVTISTLAHFRYIIGRWFYCWIEPKIFYRAEVGCGRE